MAQLIMFSTLPHKQKMVHILYVHVSVSVFMIFVEKLSNKFVNMFICMCVKEFVKVASD